mmetsp:Transcript_4675/g.18670  ORF Transcript_4675/g.18670 Transcript_4675/m.18670 type:complete len:328 (-) Transcript_4675:2348-3331(-)
MVRARRVPSAAWTRRKSAGGRLLAVADKAEMEFAGEGHNTGDAANAVGIPGAPAARDGLHTSLPVPAQDSRSACPIRHRSRGEAAGETWRAPLSGRQPGHERGLHELPHAVELGAHSSWTAPGADSGGRGHLEDVDLRRSARVHRAGLDHRRGSDDALTVSVRPGWHVGCRQTPLLKLGRRLLRPSGDCRSLRRVSEAGESNGTRRCQKVVRRGWHQRCQDGRRHRGAEAVSGGPPTDRVSACAWRHLGPGRGPGTRDQPSAPRRNGGGAVSQRLSCCEESSKVPRDHGRSRGEASRGEGDAVLRQDRSSADQRLVRGWRRARLGRL